MDDCQSKEQVKARLVAEFGDEVLALPDDEGFDLAAYLVPGAGRCCSAAARSPPRRWDGGAPGAAAATRTPAAPDGAAAKRLQSDLDRYEL